ncbi:MAG: Na+(H+)/acetate symporter ActP [Myxococcota bacterium]
MGFRRCARQFTVPDFVGDRYYPKAARLVAVFCAIFISFTYVAGQMRGVGVVLSRFLSISVDSGVMIGMVVVSEVTQGFVAQVVAFAFGLAASSFFPVIVLGIFSRRTNREGAISGMLAGIGFTAAYIIYFKFINPAANTAEHWFLGISPEGIGSVGMVVNFVVTTTVSRFTPPPPADAGLVEG